MSKAPSLEIQRTSLLNTINGVGNVLRKVGLDPFRADAEQIIRKAVKTSGWTDVPQSAEEGLQNLVASINSDSNPNPFGSLAVKRLLERTMHGRLKVEQAIANNPAIVHAPISKPVFIIGMPRTGTTILHAALHSDSAVRSPLSWECLLPYPVATSQTYNDNPQLRTIEKEFDQLFKLVPDFLQKHYLAADSPQECIGINALDFNSFQFSAQLYLPSYMDWFNHRADKLETMRFHKRFLQYLESGGIRPKRWLLKTPVHLNRLAELFEVYPDARIIMTHRHPGKVVASAASLMSSVRSLYSDHEDPARTGHEQAELWSMYFDNFLRARKKLNKENQFIDIRFEDFVNDQMQVIEKIYDHFNWKFPDETQTRIQEFLDSNPKDKHGKHKYALEIFGLDPAKIETQFATYIEFLQTI